MGLVLARLGMLMKFCFWQIVCGQQNTFNSNVQYGPRHINIIIIIICYIYTSTYDDATAAILRQNTTQQLTGGEETEWWSQSVWLGRHDGPRAIGTFFWPECRGNTLLFFGGHLGIFNDHRESGPRFNVSSEGRCFLQYSVPINILGR